MFKVSRPTVNRLRHFLAQQPETPASPVDVLRLIGRDYLQRIEAHWADFGGRCPAAETFDDGSSLCGHQMAAIAERDTALDAFRREYRQTP